jgi:SAM-dependent methyltransferase
MNSDLAKQLENSIRDFYAQEGAWFATTRGKIIPEAEFVEEYVRPGMTVVDVGAGNGRFAKLLPKNVTYIGVEPSDSLRRTAPLVPGSLPRLPLPDRTADVTVCLAVLHHIPSVETRRASVVELVRVTRPGGIILSTSWLRNPHHQLTYPVPDGECGDVWMPWTAPDGHTSQRFVHFMQVDEWNNLWTHPKLEIIKLGMFGKKDWTEHPTGALNWRVIARRR